MFGKVHAIVTSCLFLCIVAYVIGTLFPQPVLAVREKFGV